MAASLTFFDNGAVFDGEVTVDSAGTAQVFASAEQFFHSITITAKAANTGQIYLGGADVSNTINDGLDAGDTVSFSSERSMLNLANWFIDADTTSEGVEIYGQVSI